MAVVKKQRKVGSATWTERMHVTVYRMIKGGMTENAAREALGVHCNVWARWKRNHPEFQWSITEAKADQRQQPGMAKATATDTLADYVYGHLPEHLKELWRDVVKAHKDPSAEARMNAMLEKHGQRARQHLFLYAMIKFNFNASKAMTCLRVNKKLVDRWKLDPQFGELLDEMQEHKGNFFESHLIQLVKEGSEAATLMANRTFNKKRGYSEKLDLSVEGLPGGGHLIDIEKLDLPVEVLQVIMQKVRAQREGKPQLSDQSKVVDAEFEVKNGETPA